MTKSILSIMLIAAMTLFMACNEISSSAETEEKAPEQEQAPATVASSATMVMLNDTIASPRKQVTGSIDDVDLTIVYGSPSKKERTLWGDLVPYDAVWRTGANEATTIEFSGDVAIEEQVLPAGTYGFFTIPGENDWTLIFNEVAEQWGAYDYDETKDVMRVKVVPHTAADSSETLDFDIRGDEVMFMWGDLVVPFEVSAAE